MGRPRTGCDLRRLTVSDPKAVREALQASLNGVCEPRFLHRLHGVLLIAQGCGCLEVAQWFSADARTVERWVNAFNLQGLDGLRDHPAGGRAPKLSSEQWRTLMRELQNQHRPSGTAKRVSTGKRLQQHLDDAYGVELSLRQCQRILKELDKELTSALDEAP